MASPLDALLLGITQNKGVKNPSLNSAATGTVTPDALTATLKTDVSGRAKSFFPGVTESNRPTIGVNGSQNQNPFRFNNGNPIVNPTPIRHLFGKSDDDDQRGHESMVGWGSAFL